MNWMSSEVNWINNKGSLFETESVTNHGCYWWLSKIELLTMLLLLISHVWMLIPMFEDMLLLLWRHCVWCYELIKLLLMIDFELSIASNLSFLFQFEVLLFFFLLEYHMLRCVLRSTFTSSSCFTTCLQTRLLHLEASRFLVDNPMFCCVFTNTFTAAPCFASCLYHIYCISRLLLPSMVFQLWFNSRSCI